MTDDDSKIARFRGVFTANKFEQLLPQHQKIIARVVQEVRTLGGAEAKLEDAIKENPLNRAAPQAAYNASVLGRQPHQAFLIDGPKGAGKSTLLLNLRSALAQIGPRRLCGTLPNTFAVEDLEKTFPGHFKWLADDQGLRVLGQPRRLVHALPVIRPDTMEVSESIIECIFAEMAAQLDEMEQRGRTDGSYGDDWAVAYRQLDPKAEAAKKLKRELHTHVAKGWYFARQLGVEALMNDSMNFDEYISRRSSEAVVSHRRVTRWMEYVNAYLDLFDAEMLAIFLDDTDISSELTSAILHSVRMFFCHPRIVVLMAGNMHIMRQRLLTLAMSDLSHAHASLRSGSSFTAKFWRDFERDNLEEYLSKVLPRNYRHFIKPSSVDAQHLLEKHSFVTYCGDQMACRMAEYLKSRRTTRMRDRQDFQFRSARYEQLLDLARQGNRFHIEAENHIALWLLRNHYADTLAPQTARQLNQFQEMVRRRPKMESEDGAAAGDSKPDTLTSSRRVAVTLFTQSNNYGVIQRQDDFDSDAVHWVNRQRIQTAWRGPRWIKINELEIPYGTPSYEFILYRLDLEIAKPTTFRQNPNISTTMLPEPSAQKIWAPELWQTASRDAQRAYLGLDDGSHLEQFVEMSNHELRLRQELHGLARAFASPIIPANCIYFKDLRTFPDLAWAWNEKDPDYLRFFDQFAVRNIDNSFRLDRYDPRNNYFRNVVLVFASYPLLQPIPSEEFVTGSWPLHELELTDFGQLFEASDTAGPQGIGADPFGNLRWICVRLSTLYRKALLGDERPIPFPNANVIRRINWVEFVKGAKRADDRPPSGCDPDPARAQALISSVVPRYHRILNDVRRSYHAMRILEQDINNYAYLAHSSGADANTEFHRRQHVSWPPPFVHTRNDRYTLISLDKFRATIGLPSIRKTKDSTPQQPVTISIEDKRYWTPISGAEEKASDDEPKKRPRLKRPFAVSLAERTTHETDSWMLWIGRFSADGNVPGEGDPTNWSWRFSFERPQTHARLGGEHLFGKRTWRLSAADPDRGVPPPSAKFWELVASLPGVAALDGESEDSLHELGKHLLNTKDTSHAERSRMLRSIFLYLWSISPCLSSLIHLEIMGRHYWWQEWLEDKRQKLQTPDGANVEQTVSDFAEIADRLDDWEVSIAYALLATILLATSLEKNLHEDFKALNEQTETDALAARFAPLPDASITTLGLRLYAIDDGLDLGTAFKEARKFSGVFGDALLRLQLAHHYVNELRASFGKVYRQRHGSREHGPDEAAR